MMDEKRFPLERMRATAQRMQSDADMLAQELNLRLARIANTELCLPPSQQGTLEAFTAMLRTTLNTLVLAEQNLAEGLRTASDVVESTDRADVTGFSTR